MLRCKLISTFCPTRISQTRQRQFLKALMFGLKCRTAERPVAGRRAFNLPQGTRPRLFRGYVLKLIPRR